MAEKSYILAQSFHRANVQDRLWYAMNESDKDTIASNSDVLFGDKVYVLSTKKMYMLGNDNTWYLL